MCGRRGKERKRKKGEKKKRKKRGEKKANITILKVKFQNFPGALPLNPAPRPSVDDRGEKPPAALPGDPAGLLELLELGKKPV